MSGILKISEASVLALHAMMFIANHADRMVSTREIASVHHASEAHLSKVMQRLVKAGYVNSIRGPKGGFELLKDAGSITLLELYELFEGPLQLKDCLIEIPVCDGKMCVFGDLLGELNRLVINYLTNTKLSDITRKISTTGVPNETTNPWRFS